MSKWDIRTVVTIPTCGRPDMLRALLLQLDAVLSHRNNVAIIVVNNGKPYLPINKKSLSMPVHIFHEYRRGLSTVRNRLVFEANKYYPDAQYIAMLDDDSLLQHDWLTELESIADAHHADLTGGLQTLPPVYSGYGALVTQSVLCNRAHKPSGLTNSLYGTHNLLLKRAFLQHLQVPYFDEAFNLSGGEDTDFFIVAKKANAVFAWSADATIYERTTPQRLEWRALLRRHFSMGRCYAHISRKHFSRYIRARFFAGLWVKPIVMSINVFIRQGVRHAIARLLLDGADALGYTIGFFSQTPGQFYR